MMMLLSFYSGYATAIIIIIRILITYCSCIMYLE